jgi:cysteine synthase A
LTAVPGPDKIRIMTPSTLDAIGHTPLIWLEGIYVKLECANPGGSVKDRIARFMLEEASRRGDLRPGDTVVEATSGNTGIALALVARLMGHSVIIFMPEHMSMERRRMMRNLGAEIRITPKADGFEGAIALRDSFRGRPGYYVPDQFGNPDNPSCHYQTTGREILEQLREIGCDRIDCFVAGVGTGGTLMGVGAALREAMPELRVVAVEPDESAVMSGGCAGDHGIMGIGDGFIPDLVDMSKVDEVVRVGTEEAHRAAERLRVEHGYCVGRSAGANMVAALRVHEHGASVVTLWPDCANRYVSVGLQPPSSEQVRCPLREGCEHRTSELLRGSGDPE